jgi:hypothetical protein
MPFKKQIAMPMAAKPGERFQYGGYQLGVFAYAHGGTTAVGIAGL